MSCDTKDNIFLLKEFVEKVKNHTLVENDPFYTMNALAGEIGELANEVKKEKMQDLVEEYRDTVTAQIATGERVTFREAQIDEAGDGLFYFIQLLNSKGITIEEVMRKQISKIDERSYSNGRIFKK